MNQSNKSKANKVSQVMAADCITAEQNESIEQVAKRMKQHNIGLIPIVQDRKVVGVVTDRDMVIRGYASSKNAADPIGHVMTSDIVSVTPQASIEEATRVMATQQVRRLLVMQEDELVGVLALADLAIRETLIDEAGDALSDISQK